MNYLILFKHGATLLSHCSAVTIANEHLALLVLSTHLIFFVLNRRIELFCFRGSAHAYHEQSHSSVEAMAPKVVRG